MLVIRGGVNIIYLQMLNGGNIHQHPPGTGVVVPERGFGQIHHIALPMPVCGSLVGIQRRIQIHLIADVILRHTVVIFVASPGVSVKIDSSPVVYAVPHQVMDKVMLYDHVSLDVFKTFRPSVTDVESRIGNIENLVVRQVHIRRKSYRHRSRGLIIHTDIMDVVVFHIAVFHQLPDIFRVIIVRVIGIRISDIDGASRYIIEPVPPDGAVLHAFHHLQGSDSHSGKTASEEAYGIRPFHCNGRIRQAVRKPMLPNVVILRIRMSVRSARTVPCGVGKRNTDKFYIFHHMVIIGSLNAHQFFQHRRRYLRPAHIFPGPGHIVHLSLVNVQIPLTRLVQKLQGIFIINRNRSGSPALIGYIIPSRLVHNQRCPAAALLHGSHAAPGIGPLLLEDQLQVLRMPIFQNLRVRAGISPVDAPFHQGNRAVQPCFASGPYGPDAVHIQLPCLQTRRVRHINALLLIIQGKSGNDSPAADNRFPLPLMAVYYIVLLPAAVLFVQSQGFRLQIITVCQNDFNVPCHVPVVLPHQFLCPLQGLYRTGSASVTPVIPLGRDINLFHHISGRNRHWNLGENLRTFFRDNPDHSASFPCCNNFSPLVNRGYPPVVGTENHFGIPRILRQHLCIDKEMSSCRDRHRFRRHLYPLRQYIGHRHLRGYRRQ